MSLAPGAQLSNGRYVVLRALKSGSFGAVYEAEDTRLGGKRAVKEQIVDPGQSPADQAEVARMFEREARVLMGLRHPTIPRVWDFFTEQQRRYVVMDFVEGQRLSDELAAHAPLDEARVLRWGVTLCHALGYVHGQGLVHRDVKPDNIMLTSQGQLYLVDFGIARPFGVATQTMIGTAGYAPVEQYSGRAEPRSDIYALGATLHHLLTGREPTVPFSFVPARRLRPGVDARTEAVLARALQREAKDRFADAAAFAQALRDALTPPAAPTRPAAAPSPPKPGLNTLLNRPPRHAAVPPQHAPVPPSAPWWLPRSLHPRWACLPLAVTKFWGLWAAMVGFLLLCVIGSAVAPPQPPPDNPFARLCPPAVATAFAAEGGYYVARDLEAGTNTYGLTPPQQTAIVRGDYTLSC